MGDSGCLPRGGHQHGHCQGPQQRVCALACLTTWGTAWPPACLPNTGGPNLRGRGGGRTPILGKRGTVHGGSTMCCMVVSLLCTYDLHYKPHSPLKLASNGQRCPNWTRQGDHVSHLMWNSCWNSNIVRLKNCLVGQTDLTMCPIASGSWEIVVADSGALMKRKWTIGKCLSVCTGGGSVRLERMQSRRGGWGCNQLTSIIKAFTLGAIPFRCKYNTGQAYLPW